MAIEAPRRAALDTTEILENVLSFLPPHTLFVVQRVSQQWRNVIAASPPIQEKMFLRCRIKSPEIWMLTNPKPHFARRRWTSSVGERRFLDRKFRTVSASEVESGDWKKDSGGIEHLFTPVTLSPFLLRDHDLASFYIEGGTDFTYYSVLPTGPLAPHNSLRNTYLTDPPCKDCKAFIKYEACISLSKSLSFLRAVEFRSDKPVMLGDVFDRTFSSDSSSWTDQSNDHATVAEVIEELEKEKDFESVFSFKKGSLISHALKDTTIHPLALKNAEYLLYRPTENSSL